ncbi:MAG: FkbM family methyltransferase [Thermoplasmatales archaeon]|nr:MAG: FkbM family methyltransferase [Thermoplasmatales archaeon]
MTKRKGKFPLINIIKKAIKNPNWIIYVFKDNLFFNFLYGNINNYVMNYKNIQTKFLTNDDYSKHWFFPRLENAKIYEPAIIKMTIDSLKEGDVFVDVGTHLGYYACIAGKICHKVYGFEVDKNVFEILNKNIKYNDLSNVEVFNYGVTNKDGFVKIPKISKPNPILEIINDNTTYNFCKVKAISLDEFFKNKKNKPTVIKIDVEGAELLVLEGMQSLLTNENIKLFLEIHGKRLHKFNTNPKEIISFLNNYGYEVYEITKHMNIDTKTEKKLIKPENHESINPHTMLYVTKTKQQSPLQGFCLTYFFS